MSRSSTSHFGAGVALPPLDVDLGVDTGIGEIVGVAIYEPLSEPVPKPVTAPLATQKPEPIRLRPAAQRDTALRAHLERVRQQEGDE